VRRRVRFRALQLRYGRHLRAYVAARLGRDHRLVDVVTEQTWAAVWRVLSAVRTPDEKAFPWLAATARRVIIAHYLRERAARQMPAPVVLGVAA
jgi:DNA-directed RNA polymerase specialized sigma24 family protein